MQRRYRDRLTFDDYKAVFAMRAKVLAVFGYSPLGIAFLPWGALLLAFGVVMFYVSVEGRWYLSHSRAALAWVVANSMASLAIALVEIASGVSVLIVLAFFLVSILSFVIVVATTFEAVASSYATMKVARDQELLSSNPRKEPHL